MNDIVKEFRKRVLEKVDLMNDRQKALADYFMKHPEKVAFSSIRELESDLGISKATIVRFSRLIGYDGFLELKKSFCDGFQAQLGPIFRYKNILEKGEHTDKKDILNGISRELVNNIERTIHRIDREQYGEAVQLLKKCRGAYTIGHGISSYLSDIAAYLLNRVSIKSYSMVRSGLSFAEQIINLTPDEVIIAFSLPPYSHRTTSAASYAFEKGIKVISVTDKLVNDIVKYSTCVLLVDVESSTISNSITGVVALLYSLATQLSLEMRGKTLETIKSIDHVRREHHSQD